MITFEANSADAVWRQAVDCIRSQGTLQAGRDGLTKELLHVAFTITDPRQRLVFARAINPAFAIAEVIWILAGANAVEFLLFWNPRMKKYVDANRRSLHGAYGFRLGSSPRLSSDATRRLRIEPPEAAGVDRPDQIKSAYQALRETPTSRQVVLQIWDSRLDLPDPDPRSIDVPCNVLSHLLLRNGRLEWLQVIRSNDVMWGTPYNFVQFTCLQEIIAGWLGVEVGAYCQVSDSLHVYERHWEELRAIVGALEEVPQNQSDLRVASYEIWEALLAQMVEGALELTQLTRAEELQSVANRLSDLPPAYQEWVALLTAEALRRRNHVPEAMEMIERAGHYFRESWRRWLQVASCRTSDHY